MFEVITAFKLLLVGGALLVASMQDMQSREVSDSVWLFAIPVGAVLTIVEIIVIPGYPYLLAGLSVLLSAALAFGIYYAGLYGGADAKALSAIAVTLPLPPYGYVGASPFFPLTVLGNGILLSLSLIVVCLFWNVLSWVRGRDLFSGLVVSKWEKFVAVLTGVRVKAVTANSVHFNLMEMVTEDGRRELRFIHRVDNNDDETRMNRVCTTSGYVYVWATPAIPMIVFLLAGFVLYFVAGDFIFRIVSSVLG